MKPAYVACSNLSHLSAVYDLMQTENYTQVYRVMHVSNPDPKVIRVDLIADSGSRWIKVKAGNMKGIQTDLDGYELDSEEDYDSDDNDGLDERDGVVTELALPTPPLVRQAKVLLSAAQQNPVHFKSPTVVFKFVGIEVIPEIILEQLTSLGVEVEIGLSKKQQVSRNIYGHMTKVINLDITTLLAMVSDITLRFNEIPLVAYDSKPLQLQRIAESKSPLLPILKSILSDRILITTESAFKKFKKIVETIGGPTELQRAISLFKPKNMNDIPIEIQTLSVLNPQLTIGLQNSISDLEIDLGWSVWIIETNPSELFQSLDITKLKDHNVDVFGTADRLKVTTVTSNSWIQRSLENAGKEYAIQVHEPRCLIEQKWIRYTTE
ncbi:hypothetical protein HDV02_005902 [Globomyces sp. JEL0801]|nr:hypothetical protein HDV02_005902 [Globomyces sp. JEL0801]